MFYFSNGTASTNYSTRRFICEVIAELAEFKRTEVYPSAADMKLLQQYPHRVILPGKGVPRQRYRNLMTRDGVLPERKWKSRER